MPAKILQEMINHSETDLNRPALEAQLQQIRDGIRALAAEPAPININRLRELLDRHDSISEKLARSA